jgi:hypothetical protein
MRIPVLLRASLAGVVLAAPEGKDSLTFHPEAGSTLSKTFQTTGEYSLDELSLMADGQDVGAFIGQVEFSLESGLTVEVQDVYKRVEDGRPLALLRTFERLENTTTLHASQMGEMPEIDVKSALEGKTVAFTWNAETSAYELAFHESEGEDELLEGLEEDMDLRYLLPEGEVEVDGTWELDIVDLLPLLMPGGDLHFESEDAEMDQEAMEMFEGMMGSLGDKVRELVDGKCVCTFKGVREEGGTRLGEIQLEIEASGTIDLREILHQLVETAMAEAPEEVEVDMDIGTAELSFEYEGEGVLLWNVTAGRAHDLSLTSEVTVGLKLTADFEAMGESHGVDASLGMSGEMVFEVAAEE